MSRSTEGNTTHPAKKPNRMHEGTTEGDFPFHYEPEYRVYHTEHMNTLLQKRFSGAGRMPFVGTGAPPVAVSRS